MNNPTQHGACNLSAIVKAGWKKFRPVEDLGAVVGQRVVSTPNGRSYGPTGLVPCDHILHVQYERGHYQFDGKHSRSVLA
jgi:hypothetical protein